MPYNDRLNTDVLLNAFSDLATAGCEFVSSPQLVDVTGSSLPAVKRMLSRLVAEGKIKVTGKARATRYRLPTTDAPDAARSTATQLLTSVTPASVGPAWRAESLKLQQQLTLPLTARVATKNNNFQRNNLTSGVQIPGIKCYSKIAGHLSG